MTKQALHHVAQPSQQPVPMKAPFTADTEQALREQGILPDSQTGGIPSNVVVVSRVYNWNTLAVAGVPLQAPTHPDKVAPVGFMPVFASAKDAESWEPETRLHILMQQAKPPENG